MCLESLSRAYGAVELPLSQVDEHEGLEIHHPTEGPQQALGQSLRSAYLFIKRCFKMKCNSAAVFSPGILALGQQRHLKCFFLKTRLLKTPQRAQQCGSFRCKEQFTNDILMKPL